MAYRIVFEGQNILFIALTDSATFLRAADQPYCAQFGENPFFDTHPISPSQYSTNCFKIYCTKMLLHCVSTMCCSKNQIMLNSILSIMHLIHVRLFCQNMLMMYNKLKLTRGLKFLVSCKVDD